MDMLAKKIMAEQVKPTLEKMLECGISEKELMAVGQMVDIAKDLIEYDILCKQLEQTGGDHDMDEMTRHKALTAKIV